MLKINRALLSGSLILLITFNLFNLLNLIFNISMARFLSVADYGTLSFLIYVVLAFAVFSESIHFVISKYSTIEKDKGKVKNIFKKSVKKAILSSILIFILFSLVSIPVSFLIKTPYFLLALTGIAIFPLFILPISRGILQGKKMFFSLGTNMVIESTIKLIVSILLVFLGFKLYGAILGILLGMLCAFFFSLISLKDVLSSKESAAVTPQIYSYTRPVFIINLTLVLFISLDIIIAKLVFSPYLAGSYALASTISKIIFLGTQPISKAMFPISTEESQKGEKKGSRKILYSSLLIIGLIILISLVLVYLFPSLIVNLYSGKLIVESIEILFLLSLASSLLAVTNLIVLYKLSAGQYNGYLILPGFVIVQILLLSLFNSSLVTYSISLISASVIFLIGSILFLRK